ncbi:alpha/beta hydrolase [Clostridium omnivorum]|uniref:Alpha/beta hydrolase n=1 Tax=Clostridium omnivorum TaxID=1604902 RepID=A0ABQ5N9S2_9CLOT|nr:alpha/beta hydrolase [Clostridium sp. E14]GLC31839.1 alpha/beta hydrolase [Clostridium sp. E14]
MNFKIVGNPNNPKILLIHAMFVSSDSFEALSEYLKEDYFLIIPTLDGHDVNENSIFMSLEDEADKILSYLKQNNIENLDFILGTSLGAIIAFELYKRNEVQINKVFLDGGPFFNFGPFLQTIAFKKFWGICNSIRKDSKNALKKLDSLFPGSGNNMLQVCSHITMLSVRNLAHACYSFSLPKLDEAAQKPIIFLYGTKEPARMCIPRLRRYKYSAIIKKVGYKHCGYLLSNPKDYARMLNEK